MASDSTVADLKAEVARLSANMEKLQKQVAYTACRLSCINVDRRCLASMPAVCTGAQFVDDITYRKAGFNSVVTLHAAHLVDTDPDGLFAAYDLWPGAPTEMLRDRMYAHGFTAEQQEQFFFIRDRPDLYCRCPCKYHPVGGLAVSQRDPSYTVP